MPLLSMHVPFFFLFAIILFVAPVIAKHGTVHAGSESRYTKAHSLRDGYKFDPRDGWHSVNATDLSYKYRRSDNAEFASGDMTRRSTEKDGNLGLAATAMQKIQNSLKGIGQAVPVIITWYTGHDLENPSCWKDTKWAPTDASFACALTLNGWTSRPKCFQFLELCNGPKKCVFVRVVDSCAGCAAGSKHVDLTRAAFTQLADLTEGLVTVQMRPATDPSPGEWLEHLWGPK